jgi:hypothetical protein
MNNGCEEVLSIVYGAMQLRCSVGLRTKLKSLDNAPRAGHRDDWCPDFSRILNR